jgi:hypothetical protein
MASNTKAINGWDWDIRVRERNVKKGVLDDKAIERHLTQLADVGDQADTVGVPQPALGGREH